MVANQHFLSPIQVLVGILYRPPDKYDFVICLERTFSETDVMETQERYLPGLSKFAV